MDELYNKLSSPPVGGDRQNPDGALQPDVFRHGGGVEHRAGSGRRGPGRGGCRPGDGRHRLLSHQQAVHNGHLYWKRRRNGYHFGLSSELCCHQRITECVRCHGDGGVRQVQRYNGRQHTEQTCPIHGYRIHSETKRSRQLLLPNFKRVGPGVQLFAFQKKNNPPKGGSLWGVFSVGEL